MRGGCVAHGIWGMIGKGLLGLAQAILGNGR